MRTRRMLSSVAGAIGLALFAMPAAAQDYSGYVTPGFSYRDNAPEEVIVTPPYTRPERSAIGAPIVNVSMSRAVRFDDLDLTNDWGARALRARISYTARGLCSQLDAMYPASADSGDANCYRRTMGQAMYQADAAIRAARYGNGAYGNER